MAGRKKQSTEAAVREIRRRTRRKFAPEEKIRIVLEGLRGEQSISELCRREGVAIPRAFARIRPPVPAGARSSHHVTAIAATLLHSAYPIRSVVATGALRVLARPAAADSSRIATHVPEKSR
jgi:hypothetical protein